MKQNAVEAEFEEQPRGAKRARPAAPKSRPSRAIPSDRIALAKQVELLRAFALSSGRHRSPVTLSVAASRAGIKTETARLAIPFFLDVGFIERVEGGKFVIPDDLWEFERESQFSKAPAMQLLKGRLDAQWFAQTLRQRIAIRGPISSEDAVRVLANEINADAKARKALLLLLAFLEGTGSLRRDEHGAWDALPSEEEFLDETARADGPRGPKTSATVPTSVERAGMNSVSVRTGTDPFSPLHALIHTLPADRTWTQAERELWLQAFHATLSFIVRPADVSPALLIQEEEEQQAEEVPTPS